LDDPRSPIAVEEACDEDEKDEDADWSLVSMYPLTSTCSV
jgi:hypothetical protein